MSESRRLHGKIKSIKGDKGFTFITGVDDGRQKDIFAHASAFDAADWNTLEVGDHVSFDEATDRDGRAQAVHVEVQHVAVPRGYLPSDAER